MGIFGISFYAKFPDSIRIAFQFVPMVLLASGVVLGWAFKKGRPVLGLIMVFGTGWLLEFATTKEEIFYSVYYLICFLFPFNLAVLSLLKERGAFTFRNFSFFIFLGIQIFCRLFDLQKPMANFQWSIDQKLG